MASTRRGFLGASAAAALTALARPVTARAQTTPLPAAAPSATPTPAPPDPKAEILAKLARERYGQFLTAEELTMLDERIAVVERRSARLRAIRFANGEEPVTVFRARRA